MLVALGATLPSSPHQVLMPKALLFHDLITPHQLAVLHPAFNDCTVPHSLHFQVWSKDLQH